MRRLVQLLTVPLLATFVALAACQNESEGYPCSTDNNNDDCADGLVCEKPPNPSATNAPEVCCPQPGQPATTPECSVNGQVDGGNPTPPDASTFPETSTDGVAPEATTSDAPHESSSAADTGGSSGDTGASSSDAGPG
jgi:hypothetical protein